VRRRELAAYTDPLDILRRFVPTPLKAMYRIGPSLVVVQTNDFHLLPALPLEVNSGVPGEQAREWKVIRDLDTHGQPGTAKFLTSRSLTVVEMGPACLLGLDHERGEVVGFIGADVGTCTYQEFVVPLLCQLMRESVPTVLSSDSNRLRELPIHE